MNTNVSAFTGCMCVPVCFYLYSETLVFLCVLCFVLFFCCCCYCQLTTTLVVASIVMVTYFSREVVAQVVVKASEDAFTA